MSGMYSQMSDKCASIGNYQNQTYCIMGLGIILLKLTLFFTSCQWSEYLQSHLKKKRFLSLFFFGYSSNQSAIRHSSVAMRATEPAQTGPAQSAVASRRSAGRRLMVGCAARQLPASYSNGIVVRSSAGLTAIQFTSECACASEAAESPRELICCRTIINVDVNIKP